MLPPVHVSSAVTSVMNVIMQKKTMGEWCKDAVADSTGLQLSRSGRCATPSMLKKQGLSTVNLNGHACKGRMRSNIAVNQRHRRCGQWWRRCEATRK